MVQATDDEQIMSLLASGLVAAHQTVGSGAALRVPYPPALQRALERLTLRCLRAEVAPPAGLPELLSWPVRAAETPATISSMRSVIAMRLSTAALAAAPVHRRRLRSP